MLIGFNSKAARLLIQFVEQRLGILQVLNVEAFREPVVDFGEHPASFGALFTNTSLECPTCGDEIARKIAENMGQQETAIYQVLRKAQAEGTLSRTQDARALARLFLGVAWGINAANRSVADPGVFSDNGQSRAGRLGDADRNSAQSFKIHCA
jgi:glutaredoxin-related protein